MTNNYHERELTPIPHNQRPWHRLPGETAKAYAAFCVYLNMELSTRTIVGAYREKSGNKSAENAPVYWYFWAEKYQWEAREIAYSQHRAILYEREESEYRRQCRERRRKAADALMGVSLKGLRKLSEQIDNGEDMPDLTALSSALNKALDSLRKDAEGETIKIEQRVTKQERRLTANLNITPEQIEKLDARSLYDVYKSLDGAYEIENDDD